jgi:E3 ubiquitin-protein ligase HERC1
MIGQGETQCVSHCKPEKILPLAGHFVDDITAGAEHTLVLTVTGQVWGWGINSDGQLALGHTNSPVREPVLISQLSHVNIKQVTFISVHALGCSFICLFMH